MAPPRDLPPVKGFGGDLYIPTRVNNGWIYFRKMGEPAPPPEFYDTERNDLHAPSPSPNPNRKACLKWMEDVRKRTYDEWVERETKVRRDNALFDQHKEKIIQRHEKWLRGRAEIEENLRRETELIAAHKQRNQKARDRRTEHARFQMKQMERVQQQHCNDHCLRHPEIPSRHVSPLESERMTFPEVGQLPTRCHAPEILGSQSQLKKCELLVETLRVMDEQDFIRSSQRVKLNSIQKYREEELRWFWYTVPRAAGIHAGGDNRAAPQFHHPLLFDHQRGDVRGQATVGQGQGDGTRKPTTECFRTSTPIFTEQIPVTCQNRSQTPPKNEPVPPFQEGTPLAGSPWTPLKSMIVSPLTPGTTAPGSPSTSRTTVPGSPSTPCTTAPGSPSTPRTTVPGSPSTPRTTVPASPATPRTTVPDSPSTPRTTVPDSPSTPRTTERGSLSTPRITVPGSPSTPRITVPGSPSTPRITAPGLLPTARITAPGSPATPRMTVPASTFSSRRKARRFPPQSPRYKESRRQRRDELPQRPPPFTVESLLALAAVGNEAIPKPTEPKPPKLEFPTLQSVHNGKSSQPKITVPIKAPPATRNPPRVAIRFREQLPNIFDLAKKRGRGPLRSHQNWANVMANGGRGNPPRGHTLTVNNFRMGRRLFGGHGDIGSQRGSAAERRLINTRPNKDQPPPPPPPKKWYSEPEDDLEMESGKEEVAKSETTTPEKQMEKTKSQLKRERKNLRKKPKAKGKGRLRAENSEE